LLFARTFFDGEAIVCDDSGLAAERARVLVIIAPSRPSSSA
jgi:hypothetical protein